MQLVAGNSLARAVKIDLPREWHPPVLADDAPFREYLSSMRYSIENITEIFSRLFHLEQRVDHIDHERLEAEKTIDRHDYRLRLLEDHGKRDDIRIRFIEDGLKGRNILPFPKPPKKTAA